MDEKFVRDRITELRIQKKLSERQMSLDLGHSPSYINGIASGKMPSVPELLYICEYLGVKPKDFFDEDNKPSALQQEATRYIYDMGDEDVELIIGFMKRVHDKKD